MSKKKQFLEPIPPASQVLHVPNVGLEVYTWNSRIHEGTITLEKGSQDSENGYLPPNNLLVEHFTQPKKELPPENEHGTWKWESPNGISHSRGPFSGSMLVFGGVGIFPFFWGYDHLLI